MDSQVSIKFSFCFFFVLFCFWDIPGSAQGLFLIFHSDHSWWDLGHYMYGIPGKEPRWAIGEGRVQEFQEFLFLRKLLLITTRL